MALTTVATPQALKALCHRAIQFLCKIDSKYVHCCECCHVQAHAQVLVINSSLVPQKEAPQQACETVSPCHERSHATAKQTAVQPCLTSGNPLHHLCPYATTVHYFIQEGCYTAAVQPCLTSGNLRIAEAYATVPPCCRATVPYSRNMQQ